MKIGKYAIAYIGDYDTLVFFYKNFNGFIATTRIIPTTYPNKKKAKRILRRLNKYHEGDWFIVNYQELITHIYVYRETLKRRTL